MSRPDWMVPGAEVIEFTPARLGAGTARIERTTIDRVMKRDVVLANGRRYNADNPTKRNGTWEASTDLLPVSDARVAKAEAANARRRLLASGMDHTQRIERLLRELDGSYKRTTETPHAELAERLDGLAAVVAQLAEADTDEANR